MAAAPPETRPARATSAGRDASASSFAPRMSSSDCFAVRDDSAETRSANASTAFFVVSVEARFVFNGREREPSRPGASPESSKRVSTSDESSSAHPFRSTRVDATESDAVSDPSDSVTLAPAASRLRSCLLLCRRARAREPTGGRSSGERSPSSLTLALPTRAVAAAAPDHATRNASSSSLFADSSSSAFLDVSDAYAISRAAASASPMFSASVTASSYRASSYA